MKFPSFPFLVCKIKVQEFQHISCHSLPYFYRYPETIFRFLLWILLVLLKNSILGNYGRSFAYASKEFGMTGNTVLMPETAPASRERIIKEFNVNVKKLPSPKLMDGIRQVSTYSERFSHSKRAQISPPINFLCNPIFIKTFYWYPATYDLL